MIEKKETPINVRAFWKEKKLMGGEVESNKSITKYFSPMFSNVLLSLFQFPKKHMFLCNKKKRN